MKNENESGSASEGVKLIFNFTSNFDGSVIT